MDQTLKSCNKVTRVEIIDETGRVYVTGSYKTKVQLQDLGLTLKVFVESRSYSEVLSTRGMVEDYQAIVADIVKSMIDGEGRE